MGVLLAVVVLGAVEVEALADAPASDRAIPEGPGVVAHQDSRSALPTFIWAEAGPSLRALGLSPEQAARRHLWDYAARYRAQPGELAAAPLSALHDTGEGAIIATFTRPEVFRERLSVVMDRELRAVALTGYLSPGPLPRVPARLTLATVVSIVVQHVTGRWVDAAPVPLAERAGWTTYAAAQELTAPWRARPILYALPQRFEPALDLELDVADEPYRAVVSTLDGRVLHFSAQRLDAAHAYRVWADAAPPFTPWEGPTGTGALPHATGAPDAFSPAYVPSVMVTLDHASLPTADPWLPAGASSLRGNNALAYADRAAPDGLLFPDGGATSDVETPTSAAGAFDWAYDTALEPGATAAQRHASATQAFFVVNWLHDTYYPLGFDEAAGNGQLSNLGRGGKEADPLLVEVQDYRGVNGATLTPRADGVSSRLELYPFDDVSPAYVQVSGTLDAGFIAGTSFGPPFYDVAGPLVVGRATDGGTDGCRGPFLNAAQTGGAVVLLSNNGGRCAAQSQLDNATDAGAVAVLLSASGNTTTNYVGLLPSARPTVNIRSSDSAALMAELGSGGTLTARVRREALPDRDGALDTSIVAHEWTHFLSKRLVADTAGLTTTIGRAMGEGWSDFGALLLLISSSDAAVPSNAMWRGVWSIGGFGFAPPSWPEGVWYFGLRRYPYSIDRTKNDLSFRHVQDGEPLPATPSLGSFAPNSQVHNAGEIWATAMLECYLGLLAEGRLSFDEARRRMRGYLVASLKATPPIPDFLEARDALLAVAQAADPADRSAFNQAFARRGFGVRATGPDRFARDNRVVVEDFTAAATQGRIASVTLDDAAPLFCDRDGVLDVGEVGEVVVKLYNSGTAALPASTGTVSSTTGGVTFPTGGALSFPPVAAYASVTARTPVVFAGTRGPGRLDLSTQVMNASLSAALTASTTLLVDYDRVASDTETFEAGLDLWTVTHESVFLPIGTEQSFQLRRVLVTDTLAWSPTPRYPGATYLTTPALDVGTGTPLHVRFRHRYQFRAGGADGALMLISSDDGVTWSRVPPTAMTPPYPGTLSNGGQNPLRGGSAPAWTGASAGYPALVVQDFDLGSAYAGKKVKLQFALGVDQAATGNGWEIDDVRVTGLDLGKEMPFVDLGPEGGVCLNRPPVARAGADFSADERTAVQLDATASTDVDGQTLSFTWAQVSGPMVSLTGGGFMAPEVTADTPLTFRLTASDGMEMSTDEVVVTVQNVNRGPSVTASGPGNAIEGRDAELVAVGSDPDGDALSYAWTQTAGTAVTLSGQETAHFLAPIGAQTLAFSVTVSDGALTSSPATVEVVVVAPPVDPPKGCGCASGPGALLGLAVLLLTARPTANRRTRSGRTPCCSGR